MNESTLSDSCWNQPSILSIGEQCAGVRDTRPTEFDKGVLDAKTFDAIETDQLFDSINHAVTHVGQSVLYRSLSRPAPNPALAQKKQEALRELKSNSGLRKHYSISSKRWCRENVRFTNYSTVPLPVVSPSTIPEAEKMKWNSAVMATISSSMVPVLRLILVETVRTLPPPQSTSPAGVYLMPLSTLEILALMP